MALNERSQEAFSILAMIIGLLLMAITAPYALKLGGYAVYSLLAGLILFVIGLFFFVKVAIK